MEPNTAARELVVVVSGLVGLMVGSFLNVVIYRVPRQMSVVRPPSHCPTCGVELSAADNVPLLSWVVLRAKCRHCRSPISARYPIVELSTGMCFVAVAWCLNSFSPLPSLLIVVATSLAATAIDFDGLPIPRSVVLAAWIGGGSLIIVAGALGNPSRIGWAAIGGSVAAAAALTTQGSERDLSRTFAIAVLAWSASWLWPAAGLLLAFWVALVAVGVAAEQKFHRSRVETNGAVGPSSEGLRDDTVNRYIAPRLSFTIVQVAGFGLILLGSALGSPH